MTRKRVEVNLDILDTYQATEYEPLQIRGDDRAEDTGFVVME